MARKSTRRSSSNGDNVNNVGTDTGTFDVSENAEPIPGVDYTENVPAGHVNLGDGSEERPHHVVAAPSWNQQHRAV